MTFLIISVVIVIILLILYSACIISKRCSRIEELQELEVLVNDLDSHNV